jgi:hypothetical protein
LAKKNKVVVSVHGYDEMAEDDIFFRDLLDSLEHGIVVEDYPDFWKGPCCLVLQQDRHGGPVHVVWGIEKNRDEPAVLITAYRPDEEKWEDGFKRRKR